MNAQLITTKPETYQRWDRAWKRALDARGNEVLKEMFHIDVGSTPLTRGPEQTEGALRTDRIYLARRENGSVDVIHFVVQVDDEPGFESELFASWAFLNIEYPDTDLYRLHQLVILPTGAGNYTGIRRRGGVVHTYQVVNVPAVPVRDLLAGPLPTLALWSAEKPLEVIDAVVDRMAELPDLESQAAVADLALLHDKKVAVPFANAVWNWTPQRSQNPSAP